MLNIVLGETVLPPELLQVCLQGEDLGLYGLDWLPLLEELLLGGVVVPQPRPPAGPAFRCGQLPNVRRGEVLWTLCQLKSQTLSRTVSKNLFLCVIAISCTLETTLGTTSSCPLG